MRVMDGVLQLTALRSKSPNLAVNPSTDQASTVLNCQPHSVALCHLLLRGHGGSNKLPSLWRGQKVNSLPVLCSARHAVQKGANTEVIDANQPCMHCIAAMWPCREQEDKSYKQVLPCGSPGASRAHQQTCVKAMQVQPRFGILMWSKRLRLDVCHMQISPYDEAANISL